MRKHHDLKEKTVQQDLLNQGEVHAQRNRCVSSKSGPIQAKDVHTRNETDMTDMGFKSTVTFKVFYFIEKQNII